MDKGVEIGAEPSPRRQIGRRFKGKRAQNVGEVLEPCRIGIEPVGVAVGELGDLRLRSVRANLEVVAVGQGQEVRQGPLDDAKPMTIELEVADDCRVQKRDCVGGDGIPKAGVKLLGDRRAADLRPAFEHRDFEAGHREIGGGDELCYGCRR